MVWKRYIEINEKEEHKDNDGILGTWKSNRMHSCRENKGKKDMNEQRKEMKKRTEKETKRGNTGKKRGKEIKRIRMEEHLQR